MKRRRIHPRPPSMKRLYGAKLQGVKVRYSFQQVILVTTHVLVVFRVPTTHDVLTTLFHPGYPKSHLDMLNLGSLALQILLFLSLPRNTARVLFFFYFIFWRSAYDAGLGYVLTKQSKKKWIVKELQRLGWLDEQRCPRARNWIRDQLAGKMGKDYSFDVCAST